MKRFVSLLLSLLLLVSAMCIPAFAEGDGDPVPGTEPELTEGCTALGTVISSSENKDTPAANMTDGDESTYWDAALDQAGTVYFGLNYGKEVNIHLYEVKFLVALNETADGGAASYTLELFRNNRWYAVDTLTDADCVPVGFGSYEEATASQESVSGRITFTLDEPIYTQQVRLIVTDGEGNSAAPKVYELELVGKVYNNIALNGEAYCSTFKHYEWTPPHTAINGKDFEEDWHGWEPQYPKVEMGTNTSAGFSGEYFGMKFTNREYYEVNEIVLYMSLHNSGANPSWGPQDTKYDVEALVEGVWVKIAEFHDSDAVPRDYADYETAMKNDTSEYHIAAFYTIVPDVVVTTNNIRITISEFAKNYNGDESLVFPYLYEVRVYGELGAIPDIELPEGAMLSEDATANSYPYSTSAVLGNYPYLAVDNDPATGWIPKDKTAGQSIGVRFDKTYTIDDIHLQFADASFSAPFKVEALVNGAWQTVLTADVDDCFVPLPEGVTSLPQEHTFVINPVETNEIRVVFTEALTNVPQITDISANIVSSITGFIRDGATVSYVKTTNNRVNGIKLNHKETINRIDLRFEDNDYSGKYFIQAYADGIWKTVFEQNKYSESTFSHEIYVETDQLRVTFADESNAPSIEGVVLSTVNYSGDVSSYTEFDTYVDAEEERVIEIIYGKTYNVDKVIIDHGTSTADIAFTVEGLVGAEWVELVSSNVKSATKVFKIESKNITQLKITYASSNNEIPAIKEFAVNVVGMKTFMMDERYTPLEKQMAANGNFAVLGTAYTNSNYPSLSMESYINDGDKHKRSSVWIPKLEEYSAGVEIFCGVKLDDEYTIDRVVVYSGDIGNDDGIGNYFEIQALVNGEYIKVGEGNTCAKDRYYATSYKIDSVKTSDIRLVFVNTSIYMPNVLELEVYSDTDKPGGFVGHVISEEPLAVTVFESETPRFEIAGLPSNAK